MTEMWSPGHRGKQLNTVLGAGDSEVGVHNPSLPSPYPPKHPKCPHHWTQHPGLTMTYLSHQLDHKLLEGRDDVILNAVSMASSIVPGMSTRSTNY